MANTESRMRQIEELTDSQRECLRLVLAHMTSKQISRELGLSHHTVDQRLRFAIKTLGVTNRTEAALLLAEAEDHPTYRPWPQPFTPNQIPNPSPTLAAPSIRPDMDMDYDALLETDNYSGPNTLHESHSNTSQFGSFSKNPSFLPPIDIKTIRKNTMSTYTRLAFIAGLSAINVLVFAVSISALQSLSTLYL